MEAEAVPELSERFAVSVVPTFLMLRAGEAVDKFEGADVPSLVQRVQSFRDSAATSVPRAPTTDAPKESADEALNARLAKLIHTAPAMLFMCVSTTLWGAWQQPSIRFLTHTGARQEGDTERSALQILANDRGDAQ